MKSYSEIILNLGQCLRRGFHLKIFLLLALAAFCSMKKNHLCNFC